MRPNHTLLNEVELFSIQEEKCSYVAQQTNLNVNEYPPVLLYCTIFPKV